jgi:hypothetical protein
MKKLNCYIYTIEVMALSRMLRSIQSNNFDYRLTSIYTHTNQVWKAQEEEQGQAERSGGATP